VGADELQLVGGFGAVGVVGMDEGVALHGRDPWEEMRVEGDLRSGAGAGSGDPRTTALRD
jgi:hypothetical protein